MTCSGHAYVLFRACDLKTLGVLFPFLACAAVQQVFLDGKPVHSQAPGQPANRTVEEVECRSAATAANTAAKLLDNACTGWTAVDCRPSARTAADGPGRLA